MRHLKLHKLVLQPEQLRMLIQGALTRQRQALLSNVRWRGHTTCLQHAYLREERTCIGERGTKPLGCGSSCQPAGPACADMLPFCVLTVAPCRLALIGRGSLTAHVSFPLHDICMQASALLAYAAMDCSTAQPLQICSARGSLLCTDADHANLHWDLSGRDMCSSGNLHGSSGQYVLLLLCLTRETCERCSCLHKPSTG